MLVGTGVKEAAAELPSLCTGALAENGTFAPGRWARQLAKTLTVPPFVTNPTTATAETVCTNRSAADAYPPTFGRIGNAERILLPASADGRDLAPRLAAELGRPLLAGAIRVTAHGAEVARWGDRVCADLIADGPFVATLQPGVRGSAPASETVLYAIELPHAEAPDVTVIEVLDPEPGTVDLAEAPRIFGAGAGLGNPESVALLEKVGNAMGAALGATRVVTDAGWTGYQRQIGTTGVVVHPELYVAFGVSGAAQHVGGLGDPAQVVSVNLDESCPMTAMADLGIVADAPAVLAELARMLEVR
ncbi:electron transfer flavoprotein subunit alpha/FixB family protein [Amycolatopsis sp. RM579]|uniref:Electron transfer flavoprotein subunit alpha/FixB family protein n=1 Tax=Amycolatopsis pithecellobii TaxID=664692 RepID=A0A6N7YNR6_9PSEU|nr:electron transfer flavoprotein subunit alpha/FixB family protein [Amycolatopsis pithecellobii]